MGKVVSLIAHKNAFDIYLDFENATPNSPNETTVYNEVSAVLDRGPGILEQFHKYKGCSDEIKAAISKPTPSNEQAAWEAVSNVVVNLKKYYDFSMELQGCANSLIVALTKVNPLQSLNDQQALAKLLADLIDFVLRFDELKMKRPQLQNDFSHYRRMVSRKSKDPNATSNSSSVEINEETANRMSLFFASSTPMLTAVANQCKSMSQGGNIEVSQRISDLFSTMANVCHQMVSSEKITSKETKLFCLRAMTGAIIIYDHVHPLGAFSKKSAIKIKPAINILKTFEAPASPDAPTSTTALVNALKFTTLTLHKPTTPASIKSMLSK